MKSIETAARVMAENTIVVALSRVMMAIGVPLILASIFWVSSQIVALDRRVAVVEGGKPETERRLSEVERQNQRFFDEAARVTNRFGSVEAGIATLLAQQSATQRSVERIERALDSQRN